MIHIDDRIECCGCTACASVCSHNAIEMRPDSMGFLYPVVNNKLCVECGQCDEVCQFKTSYNRYDNYDKGKTEAYSFRLKNESQLIKSQSGGAFFILAKKIIGSGGIVYGVKYTEHWRIIHARANTVEELEPLRMSKYVQSDLRGVYKQVLNDLKNGEKVLFSGTACQVAGLKSYIPSRYHKQLLCIDIICHGVPSPEVWKDYVKFLEHKYQSPIVKVSFRDKRFGWHGARETFLFENGREINRRTYNHLYFSGYTLRPSCTNCKFTNIERVGDITIGDLWGLPKNHIYEKDNKGASLVMVNSAKGKYLFSKVANDNIINQIDINQFLQPQLQYPTSINPNSNLFERDYIKKGFIYVVKHYGNIGWQYKLKHLYIQIKNNIKSLI